MLIYGPLRTKNRESLNIIWMDIVFREISLTPLIPNSATFDPDFPGPIFTSFPRLRFDLLCLTKCLVGVLSLLLLEVAAANITGVE